MALANLQKMQVVVYDNVSAVWTGRRVSAGPTCGGRAGDLPYSKPRCQPSFWVSNQVIWVPCEPNTNAQGPSPNSAIRFVIHDCGLRASARITGVPENEAKCAPRAASSCSTGMDNA